jgi:hypothetical protein
MRIIFAPQFPSEMRYSEWWYTEFPLQFRLRGYDVHVLGHKYALEVNNRRSNSDMFFPVTEAIKFESEQIKEYSELGLRHDDILFLADTSFPGLFANVLFHKRPKKLFAFCHATSLNHLDYFEKDRQYKFPIETSQAELFTKIFVGSEYHQRKLGWFNTVVTYLPKYNLEYSFPTIVKKFEIMSASRPTPQKVDSELESFVERSFNLKIERPTSNTWYTYYQNLASAKILLITALEDTFGYQIVDAVTNNCIPLARRSFAYPELLPDNYLYSNKIELFDRIDNILNSGEEVPVPTLLCEKQMNNFFNVICEEMSNAVSNI